MPDLVRFGVSIEQDLYERFDIKIARQGYKNRSEAIRDLIRNSLVEEKWDYNAVVAGGISIVYNHHHRDILTKIMDVQHDYYDLIISSQHVHLGHSGCLEILVVKGKSRKIQELCESLKSIKGVRHVGITRTGVSSEII